MGAQSTKTQKQIQISKNEDNVMHLPKTKKKSHTPRNIIIRRSQSQKRISSENDFSYEKPIEKNQDLKDLHQLYESCLRQYDQHKIDKAYQLSTKMHSKYHSIKRRFQENDDFLQICKNKIETIRKQYEEIKEVEAEINKTVWNQQKSTKNCAIKASYQKSTISTQIETELNVKFQVIYQTLSEIQLYPDLSSVVSSANTLQEPSDNCRLGHFTCKIPLMSNRQSYFVVHVYNRLQHDGTILFLTKSLEKNQALQKRYNFYPKAEDGSVAIINKYIFFKYKPVQNNKAKIIMNSCLDIQASFIPKFALDWAIATVSQQIYTKIQTISKQFKGSKWQQNINKNKFLKKINIQIQNKANSQTIKSIQ